MTTRLNAMPLANFFPKIQREDTSIYLLGWGVPTLDALYSIQSLLASRDGEPGNGIWNYGNYSNPRMDELNRIIKNEGDPEKRTAAIHEAMDRTSREKPRTIASTAETSVKPTRTPSSRVMGIQLHSVRAAGGRLPPWSLQSAASRARDPAMRATRSESVAG